MKTSRFVLLVVCLLCLPSIVCAKDVWINVRSKNFNMIGNASEKDIRGAATRLEQFREVFRLLLPRSNFNSFTPTTVVVFKSQNAYKPYLPVRKDGKADTGIAGYFQPGDDVNYITLSTEGEDKETFSVIFHEYTHFMVDNNLGRSTVPPWFNEGLAEYYETFRIEKDQEVHLGDLQNNYLYLLNQEKMIPLEQFFAVDNYSLHNNGNHGRTIFYGQAWALMHYLQEGNKGARRGQLSKFLSAVLQNKPAKEAFQEAFQTDYAGMEKELRKYVAQNSFFGSVYTLKQKLTFDAEMKTFPLSEAEADAFLGDLLLHSNRADAAETKLKEAIALDPKVGMAYASLGSAQSRQRNFAEAEKNLEKAISLDSKNYLAYFNYAYSLSREQMDDQNMVASVSDENVEKMRASLKKTMELNPNFPESYNLLGFVDLIAGKNFDEGVAAIRKALSLQPGNQSHALVLAQLLARQEKFDEAQAIAVKLQANAEDAQMRQTADYILREINSHREYTDKIKKMREENAANGANNANGEEHVIEISADDATTPEEAVNKAINNALRKPANGEQRILGYLTAIECGKSQVFVVRGEKQTVKLVEMQGLQMTAFTPEMNQQQIGCGVRKPENLVLATYRPKPDAKSKTDGEIVALEFMPKTFKLL